ncbi:hypothetical protein IQ238_28120 [Pleurocapsales cyanobacterium LEGE 06147]|nr:hypothetical protein [Pleurocapsales cyanobacterium LEGE 06147]
MPAKPIAFQLQIPTEDENDKSLTVDALKEEILVNCGEDTLLILPEAKRLTTSIRYWLEDALGAGVRVVCFAVANPGRDIFLEMLEIELELPSALPKADPLCGSPYQGGDGSRSTTAGVKPE